MKREDFMLVLTFRLDFKLEKVLFDKPQNRNISQLKTFQKKVADRSERSLFLPSYYRSFKSVFFLNRNTVKSEPIRQIKTVPN